MNPLSGILHLLNVLQQIVQSVIKDRTKEMNDAKEVLGNLQNGIVSATRSVNSAFSSAANSFNSITNTLVNKCANVTFCTGGAFNTLKSNISQLATSLESIENAWNNVDYDSIARFGHLTANVAILEDQISRLDEINKDINKILQIFE